VENAELTEWRNCLAGIFDPTAASEKKKENLITAIYIGTIFIAIAAIYLIHLPNSLWDEVVNFFSQLTLSPIPGTSIPLPAPSNPAAYTNLYFAAFEFALAVGILEIVILLLRIYFRSPVARKAETVENIVFWMGTSYLIIAYLINITIPAEWFVFWAGIIMLFGLALVARAFILLAKR
jgi:hypothetical protein